ncbi:viral A-type inclusion protein [Salmonirosea aquatica]|uniref:Viral A-type inclusion protein n=1 Tax=Salmonirosea aquatica TaxID=2654236 RepID=A0A7C9F737_9BACT|nr:viral A-type inclusion protein [Cytophagaceae bacterium SJW1-29]
MNTRILLFILVTFSISSCNQKDDRVQELEKEVLDIHDAVMPKMGEIMALKKGLDQKIAQLDSMQQEGVSSTTLAQERQQVLDLSKRLTQADSLMMGWMYEYRGDSAKALPDGEALEYFRLEKDKIKHVQKITDESILDAKKFLK